MKEDVARKRGKNFENRGVNITPGQFFGLTIER